jgi:hypothetical protein
MKNKHMIVISAAFCFVIGTALGWFAVNVPLPFWYGSGFARSVSHSPVLSMIWSNAPTWFLVVVTCAIGGLVFKHRLMLFLVLFGVGFAYMPSVIWHYFNQLALPSVNELVQRTIIVGVAVLSGFVSHRFAHADARHQNHAA